MKWRWGVFVGLAAGLGLPAQAWPCGSGSSGESSSSSDDDSDSGLGDSSSNGAEPACVETSFVVGRSHCARNRFGRWAVGRMPGLRLGFGTSVHRFALDSMRFAGRADHGDGILYAMKGAELTGDPASAISFDMHASVRLNRYLYAGAEAKFGAVMADTRALTRDSGLTVDPSATLYGEAGLVAGIAVPIGGISVRSEALVGRRVVGLSVVSSHGDCVSRSLVYDGTWLVQPRVAVESWVTPWMTAGVQFGTNALAEGDVTMGIFVTGHTRAFDASRGP